MPDALSPHILPRARGTLLGLAVGDTLGTTVEFRRRGSFPPLTDIVGGGPFGLAPGQWTDDTSMALCLATSLVECGFDPEDQMARYCRWYREGYLSATGRCFDIGGATRRALQAFERTGEPYAGDGAPDQLGNGSLMRLAPVVLYAWPRESLARHLAGESSRTTHGAVECVAACRLFATVLMNALAGRPKDALLPAPDPGLAPTPRLAGIARGELLGKPVDAIRGGGHVLDCLEAALWCFYRTETFADAVLAAANLGDDADTTAAVCGQVAGAWYGEGAIPAGWLRKLHMRREIGELAEKLVALPPAA
jgi:ADP-ribosyl-[dinitrogen reductase] hydrolase